MDKIDLFFYKKLKLLYDDVKKNKDDSKKKMLSNEENTVNWIDDKINSALKYYKEHNTNIIN